MIQFARCSKNPKSIKGIRHNLDLVSTEKLNANLLLGENSVITYTHRNTVILRGSTKHARARVSVRDSRTFRGSLKNL